MRSLIASLSLLLTLTACTPFSKQDSVPAESGEKAKQQEQYDAWFQSLTPEQRAREIQRQHERALVP